MDEFIGTTSLRCFLFPIPLLPREHGRFLTTSENEKKKGSKIKMLVSFRHSDYREPICRFIPFYGGISNSPPYLLGVSPSSPLGSNKHRRTSEEDERKKEYGPP
jgi:hypothetical protein